MTNLEEMAAACGLGSTLSGMISKETKLKTIESELAENCPFNMVQRVYDGFTSKLVASVTDIGDAYRVTYDEAFGIQGVILQKDAGFVPEPGMLALQNGGMSMGDIIELMFYTPKGDYLFFKTRKRIENKFVWVEE